MMYIHAMSKMKEAEDRFINKKLSTCPLFLLKESRGFLDLVAVGTDSNIIQRLLMYGASFAPRAVIHSGSQPLFASLSRESGSYTIDGKCQIAQT